MPRDAAQLPNYHAAFTEAVRFTRHCGFAAEDLVPESTDRLDPEGKFFTAIGSAAGIRSIDGIAGQCLKWCHFLQPTAEAVLGKRVWLTIGQLWKGEQWIFAPSFNDLERWTKQGFSTCDFEGKQGLDFHAWLTVETGEIIEPTFLTTLASVNPKIFGDVAGTAVWGRDPDILLGHRYIPMLIGREAAETISSMAPIPLLARSLDELRQAPAALVMVAARPKCSLERDIAWPLVSPIKPR